VLTFFRDLFRNIFRRENSERIAASAVVETAPLIEEQPVSQPSLVSFQPPQLIVGIGQSTGIQRDHNEDTLYSMQAILADGDNDLPFGIFIVADGMGGHLNGEIASGCAARKLGEYLLSKLYGPFLSGHPDSGGESTQEVIENGVGEAHREVLRNAPGGGTTMTTALVIGDQVTIAHVGDTRAYFIYSDGRIQVMTQDHSLVKRLLDLGQIDEKEAIVHPQRNVVYRALGQSEPFRPDINRYTLPDRGYLMLCSDGLWGSVPDKEVSQIVQSSSHPAIGCQKLIAAANAAGGPDNISVILVQYLG
jgi:serine/threonine protein phosphatase PrpC